MTQSFENCGTLMRFLIRRDRIRIPIWIASFILITFLVAEAFHRLYTTEIERQGMAETMKNPAMIAMVGPGYGLDNYTIGAMMAHQMLLFTAIVVAIMSILLVTRHTRSDEEAGRIELIRSMPTGRLANLSATMTILIIVHFLLAIGIGFSLYALGIESMDLEGSLLYGAALGGIGIFFSALTAVFAQLSENARGTIGLSIAALLLFYLVRAVGDVSNEVLSWVSPLGWILHSKVFVENNWWPVLGTIGISLLLLFFAFYLHAKRDLEAGLLPARPGKKFASRFLQSPTGLFLRLQRTAIISWAIGLFILGVSYGSIFGDLESFFNDNEMMQQLLAANEGVSLTEQFMTLLMKIMAMVSSIPPLMIMLKIVSEERKNRIEHLFSRAVSRNTLLGSSLIIAILVSIMMLSLTGFGLWAAASTVMEDPISLMPTLKAAFVYLPAIWLMISLTVLFIGFIPKRSSVIWFYLSYSFVVIYLGALLQLPDWLGNLSPYHYIPEIPVEEINLTEMAVLLFITVSLSIIGFIRYNRRDIFG
ncbi:ABC transporter permease [Pseudogracilibacillus auburnensis]|uniref:ABC-2 type transport system permease protein n=1 Tax=Pseudogracilibacillus auburnensis TaxID=1494959 RepID=A0A2V3WBE2_9BACI|nr:ABC transporter permease [Pseudogracilibacillus auburnensis]PXW90331.1 ABC-2 type transport system permease protein [Pseudogracilibacillus auburnensis]